MKYIDEVKEMADMAEFILFYTGWDQHWGSETYFGEYPTITAEVAEYIIRSNKKGVGLDVMGIDSITDENLTIYRKIFAETEIVVIENLTRLGEIGTELFTFCTFPLKHENADGALVGKWMVT